MHYTALEHDLAGAALSLHGLAVAGLAVADDIGRVTGRHETQRALEYDQVVGWRSSGAFCSPSLGLTARSDERGLGGYSTQPSFAGRAFGEKGGKLTIVPSVLGATSM